MISGQRPDEQDEWSWYPTIENWRTGTAIDEFTPIYVALGVATKLHGAFTQDEIDNMDLPVIATLLGITNTDAVWGNDVDIVTRRMEAAKQGKTVDWSDV